MMRMRKVMMTRMRRMMRMMSRRSEDDDEDDDEDEDEDNVGGTHRHQPLRYIIGGDEPQPPRVPAPSATHIRYERIGVTDS